MQSQKKNGATDVRTQGSQEKSSEKKPAPKGKRKRDDEEAAATNRLTMNLSLNFDASGLPSVEAASNAKKPKQVARRGTSSAGSRKAPTTSSKAVPTSKQPAVSSKPARGGASVRGRGLVTPGQTRGRGSTRGKGKTANIPATVKSPSPQHRPLQTARRSGGFLRGRGQGAGASTIFPNEHENDFEDGVKEENSSGDEVGWYSDNVSPNHACTATRMQTNNV